jgi:hypothetical protein
LAVKPFLGMPKRCNDNIKNDLRETDYEEWFYLIIMPEG